MIEGLILSIQFLTRIPINTVVEFNKKNLRTSMLFFPFVGMLLGFLAYLINSLFSNFSREIGAIFTVLAIIILTGGLHLDGLSDMFDGFFSNQSKEKTLEIMKDSRVGAFGVISLVMIILLKYSLILEMGKDMAWILIFSLGNSRLVQSHKLAYKPSARKDGLGHMFRSSQPKKEFIISAIIYILILVFIDIRYLIPLLVNFIFGEMVYNYSYKKIGGITGDVLGALAEMGEVVSMLSFIGVIKWI